jgi:hypothetical protein
MVAVLVLAAGLSTRTVMVRTAPAPLLNVPTVQTPVALLKVPVLGVALTKPRPGGMGSLTVTPVAASGPLLVNVMV